MIKYLLSNIKSLICKLKDRRKCKHMCVIRLDPDTGEEMYMECVLCKKKVGK